MPEIVRLPHWVRAEPAQERVLDAVGLTTILDECASAILPGISVLTRRARYLSFLCYARSRSASGAQSDLHAWEVSLAHAEHLIHRTERPVDCSFLGKNHIESQWNDGHALNDPTTVTQTPGWLQYRPSMVTAYLVAPGKPYELTDDGERLAKLYRRHARPPRNIDGRWHSAACLSHARSDERTALRQILGIQGGGRWTCLSTSTWKTRRATIALLLAQDPKLSAVDRLKDWCGRRRKLSDHAKCIVRAGAWSSLSFGMTVLLAAWVSQTQSKRSAIIQGIRAARRRRIVADSREISRDAVTLVRTDNAPIESAIAAIRDALTAIEFLDDQSEQELVELAHTLVSGTDPGEALKQLTERHDANKGVLAWTIPENLASMPRKFVMPGMRIDALLSLIRDVGERV